MFVGSGKKGKGDGEEKVESVRYGSLTRNGEDVRRYFS